LYAHINQEGLYIAASARWPDYSKQYRCIPASGPYRKRPSASSIPFLCIGRRDGPGGAPARRRHAGRGTWASTGRDGIVAVRLRWEIQSCSGCPSQHDDVT
ncbi:hypothetical protein BDW68DRAFT_164941, partial [Aspergillus falconensis]